MAGVSEAAHRVVLVGTPFITRLCHLQGSTQNHVSVCREGGWGETWDSWGHRGASHPIRQAVWRSLAIGGQSSGWPSEEGARVPATI